MSTVARAKDRKLIGVDIACCMAETMFRAKCRLNFISCTMCFQGFCWFKLTH